MYLLTNASDPVHNAVTQEREAVEGSDRSRVSALEALNSKLTSELEDCKREQVGICLSIVHCMCTQLCLLSGSQCIVTTFLRHLSCNFARSRT